MELGTGARVGTSAWIVQKKLGAGAFGDVFEVEHEVTHKQAACKVLKPVDAGKKGDVVRDKTLQAARLLARSEHPNLVEVYDAGYLETNPPRNWVVMELLRGREVSKVLEEEHRLEPSRAVRYIEAAASAVAVVSANGVVHRDLKPDNIFVTERDVVKVLDFDSAHMPRAQSMIGKIVGTPLYMSPEHYRGEKLDSRTDVWALGVILYEMLTGKRPFGGANVGELAAAVITRPLPVPQDVVIPADVWAVVQKATEKDRNNRYASMADFAAALQALRQNRSSGAASVNYVETERLSADHMAAVVSSIPMAGATQPQAPAGMAPSSHSTRQAYTTPAGAPDDGGKRHISVGAAIGMALGALVVATGAVVGVTSAMSGSSSEEPSAASAEPSAEVEALAPDEEATEAATDEDEAPTAAPSADAFSSASSVSASPSPPAAAPPPSPPAARPVPVPSPPPPSKPGGHVRW